MIICLQWYGNPDKTSLLNIEYKFIIFIGVNPLISKFEWNLLIIFLTRFWSFYTSDVIDMKFYWFD